ncbi:MAG: DUF2971 domain-containing protein [Alphaproteobacteria bacterium]|nr:MAG: DUF2971 domain-containing protein [Alphaproteobacteria bacterium]
MAGGRLSTSKKSADAKERDLLKFCGPTEYALQNLENLVLYCQHVEGFNDPFEFWTEFLKGVPDPEKERARFVAAATAWGFPDFDAAMAQDPAEYFESLEGLQPPFEDMRDGMRIACFGSEAENLLMWSHYADGLRGFCIAFDETLIVEQEPEGYLTDVAYLDRPPQVDSFVYAVAVDQEDYHLMAIDETQTAVTYLGKTDEVKWIPIYKQEAKAALSHMHRLWQHAFAAKPLEWQYERERRLLVQTWEDDKAAILRPYPKEAVRGITIGERMPPAYRERLLAIVHKVCGAIPVRTARRASDQYTLIIESP